MLTDEYCPDMVVDMPAVSVRFETVSLYIYIRHPGPSRFIRSHLFLFPPKSEESRIYLVSPR